ncbi:MAG: tRNA pseudouridine(38-40) synthase TruA [Lachnospiraceae bacterium]|nr:tRNA pseudouridine(38-40) synthase TruA [Lachnospiraceae bacterium]
MFEIREETEKAALNYKMVIQYDGSRFYGWEHQPGQEMTIQGKLESVLSLMVGEPVEVIGAGRTDAGVHAKGMVANAKFTTEKGVDEIRDYMNQYLPDDICIREVRIAADGFHSRYKAQGKTYQYTCYVGETKPVFDRKYVHVLEKMPDVDAMKEAASHLMGTHDFASFCGNPKMKKSTVRMVDRIDIEKSGDYLRLTYHGSGFLQYMVRILTGTLLEVGFGQRSPQSIPELIEAKNRSLAGPTAPAKGLCLLKVDY